MREKLQKMISELRLIADASDKGGHEVSTDCLRTFAEELEAVIKPQWIPVSNDKPKGMGDVWVFNGDVQIGWWSNGSKCFKDAFGDKIGDVTHWMPIDIPEPPEVKP